MARPPAAAAAPRASRSAARVLGRGRTEEIFLEGEEGKPPPDAGPTRQPGSAQPSKNAARSAGPRFSSGAWVLRASRCPSDGAAPSALGGRCLRRRRARLGVRRGGHAHQLVAGLLAVRGLVRRARPLDDAGLGGRASRRPSRVLGLPRPVDAPRERRHRGPADGPRLPPDPVLPKAAAAWDADRRRIVLLHELAHVSRRDTLARIAAETVAALYWFHPLAHAAVASLRRESERAADDLVLASGTRPSDYAAHLVAIVRGPRARARALGARDGAPVAGRGARARDSRPRARAPADGGMAGPPRGRDAPRCPRPPSGPAGRRWRRAEAAAATDASFPSRVSVADDPPSRVQRRGPGGTSASVAGSRW